MPAPPEQARVTWCHLLSLQKKILKEPAWEIDCVTYSLDRNTLNRLEEKDLWKMTIEKKAHFMSFYVRASDLKNGKLAARQVLGEGI
jgi:hypothetical protein